MCVWNHKQNRLFFPLVLVKLELHSATKCLKFYSALTFNMSFYFKIIFIFQTSSCFKRPFFLCTSDQAHLILVSLCNAVGSDFSQSLSI